MITRPRSFHYDDEGKACLGEQKLEDIIKKHGSPLYILDQETIEYNCNQFLDTLATVYPHSKVLYAGKANLSIGIVQLMKKLGMYLDISSGGELYTALKAGMPANKIYFHGNNKTDNEIQFGIQENICFVVDNIQECHNIVRLNPQKKPVSILLRLKPEIDAHTHEYIRTGQLDSKFGIERKDIYSVLDFLLQEPCIQIRGIHSHIGSQIFDTKPYLELIDILIPLLNNIHKKYGLELSELNCGGGMGIFYANDDSPLEISSFLETFCTTLTEKCKQFGLTTPTLLFEPGRSIVGPAGITVYKIGTVKEITDLKTYLFVDGGMADNPRPIMYQAQYSFDTLTHSAEQKSRYSIAGKYCESGDILAENIELQNCKPGDYLIVFGTGAYNYSMASNYNRNCRPATVLVNKQTVSTLVKRESYEDLIKLDCQLTD